MHCDGHAKRLPQWTLLGIRIGNYLATGPVSSYIGHSSLKVSGSNGECRGELYKNYDYKILSLDFITNDTYQVHLISYFYCFSLFRFHYSSALVDFSWPLSCGKLRHWLREVLGNSLQRTLRLLNLIASNFRRFLMVSLATEFRP